MPESFIDRFGVYQPEVYAPTDDRRVVGSMLDYRKMFSYMVELEGGLAAADVAGIHTVLNGSPMSLLGMDSAARVLQKLADNDSTLH